MTEKILNGEQALAYGALAAGVGVVTSYPGSPSSGTVEILIELAREHEIYVEWSCNERVALEIGIGASIAGRRALICTKSVGMNVMLDPLMTLNLTPVHGGLVILLGDDPGAYGSQNDQDTRQLAPILEMPMLEPATPAEAYAMVQEAFAASERLNIPIILRITRSFSKKIEQVNISDLSPKPQNLGLFREPWRFVPVPNNAVEKHADLHQRIESARRWQEYLPWNQANGSGGTGVIAVGFAYQKLMDVVGSSPPNSIRLLKLSSLYPLPENLIADFLAVCDKILVLEEIEPYVENQIKVIAFDHGLTCKILGKRSGHISREGELFRWQIQEALARFIPNFAPVKNYSRENEHKERPKKESHCKNCRYDEVLDALQSVAAELQQKLILVGDPGCLVTVAERLDAKFAIGSAVGVADGFSKAGASDRAVALFGDSSFFHTSLPAICNAVYNKSNVVMVVLDNCATMTSGFQPNPGTGKNAFGENAPKLNIGEIAKACGVSFIRRVRLDETGADLQQVFRETLQQDDLALVWVEIPRSVYQK